MGKDSSNPLLKDAFATAIFVIVAVVASASAGIKVKLASAPADISAKAKKLYKNHGTQRWICYTLTYLLLFFIFLTYQGLFKRHDYPKVAACVLLTYSALLFTVMYRTDAWYFSFHKLSRKRVLLGEVPMTLIGKVITTKILFVMFHHLF